MYGKIFDSIYKGTLYGHWEALVTFQQMIVLADADGIVDMTPQAMCAHTSIPIEIIEKGLKKLAEPDPYSRTPGEDGRRIVCIDEHRPWGWQIVNYLKYKHLRDSDTVREQNRIRAQRFRDKRNDASRCVTPNNAESRHTDTDTDTDIKINNSCQQLPLPTPEIPYKEIVSLYNEHMVNLPKVRELTNKRRGLIRTAWQANSKRKSVQFWKAYFEECSEDNFLNGTGPYKNGHENWQPSFDYLMRGDVITRVYEKAMQRAES